MNTLAAVRLGLWCWFYFCCLLAWVLAAAFIGRTEDNFGLYAPSAVVVLVAGLLGNTLLPLWRVDRFLVFLSYARTKQWPYGALILEFIATFTVWGLFLAGCIGPDSHDAATGTGANREVVGATEMGVPNHHAPASTGPQGAYTGQPEPKGPVAPSAYTTGNTQMPQA
ncbi:hypothetical protein JCM3774_000663 [Rhodotorula dairenensis]